MASKLTYHGVVSKTVHEMYGGFPVVDVEPEGSLKLVTGVQQQKVLRVLTSQLLQLGHPPRHSPKTSIFLSVPVIALSPILVRLLKSRMDIVSMN